MLGRHDDRRHGIVPRAPIAEHEDRSDRRAVRQPERTHALDRWMEDEGQQVGQQQRDVLAQVGKGVLDLGPIPQ